MYNAVHEGVHPPLSAHQAIRPHLEPLKRIMQRHTLFEEKTSLLTPEAYFTNKVGYHWFVALMLRAILSRRMLMNWLGL